MWSMTHPASVKLYIDSVIFAHFIREMCVHRVKWDCAVYIWSALKVSLGCGETAEMLLHATVIKYSSKMQLKASIHFLAKLWI